ncbi:alpha/beta hydrolase [Umezawaea sp.]|uniref:alpha/beta fold hydrolase n=1 Tax=Umezawaea sp. TaxID=1955258 RepID=UPI002ED2BD20
MAALPARDGTTLAYAEVGDGPPLVCLPGGPMQDAAYLGGLGGLSARHRLVLLDPRGTGGSGTPADPASYRCDRQVDDVEALREHLGPERIDLLAHSAGANLAVLYATAHPDRVSRLVLVTPSTFAVGLTTTADHRREVLRRRADDPGHAGVSAAFEAIVAGEGSDWDALVPFTYGRWDAAARAHHAAQAGHRNTEAAAAFGAEGAYAPETTRAALAAFTAPVLLLAGDLDMSVPPQVVAAFADLFPTSALHVQSGAGHFPWLDDPARFTATVTAFLAERPA